MGDKPGARNSQRLRKRLYDAGISTGGSSGGSFPPTQVSVYDYLPEAGPAREESPYAANWRIFRESHGAPVETEGRRRLQEADRRFAEADRQLREATAARKQAEKDYAQSRRETAQLYRDWKLDSGTAYRASRASMKAKRDEVKRLARESREHYRELQDELRVIQQRIAENQRLIGSIGRQGDTSFLAAELTMLMGMLSATQPLVGDAVAEEAEHRRNLKLVQNDLRALAGAKRLDDEERRGYEAESREIDRLERENAADFNRERRETLAYFAAMDAAEDEENPPR
jgi:hypothetical protein